MRDDFPDFKRRIWFAVIAGLLVLLALALLTDLREVGAALASFNPRYIPIILGLTLLNYLLRFVKWHYYLRLLAIRPGLKNSGLVFTSGLSMSVTPAKLGEVLKSYLLQRMHGIDISRTVPVVLAERVTDMLGLVAIAMLSFSALRHGGAVLVIVLLLFVGLVAVIQSRTVSSWILDRASRIPRVSRFVSPIRSSYESAYLLSRPLPLAIATPLSVVSWGFECVALHYVLLGFGHAGGLALSSFAFAFSSLAGAVSMVPGGLAVAEGSMMGLLILGHVPSAQAAGATTIIRFCTLWFGVALGAIALAVTRRRLGGSHNAPATRTPGCSSGE